MTLQRSDRERALGNLIPPVMEADRAAKCRRASQRRALRHEQFVKAGARLAHILTTLWPCRGLLTGNETRSDS